MHPSKKAKLSIIQLTPPNPILALNDAESTVRSQLPTPNPNSNRRINIKTDHDDHENSHSDNNSNHYSSPKKSTSNVNRTPNGIATRDVFRQNVPSPGSGNNPSLSQSQSQPSPSTFPGNTGGYGYHQEDYREGDDPDLTHDNNNNIDDPLEDSTGSVDR